MATVETTVEVTKSEPDIIVDAKTWEVIVTITVVGIVVGSIMIVGMRKDITEVINVDTSVVVERVIVTITKRLNDERKSDGGGRAGNERFWMDDYLICLLIPLAHNLGQQQGN